MGVAVNWRNDRTASASPKAQAYAKRMRRDPTPHERIVWRALRQRLPIEGTHFRRQMPIGVYIVDFCCLSHRLIIEVDGSQHGTDDVRRHDDKRTRFLASQGFRMLRFWNEEIDRNIDGVLDTIHAALSGTTPTPAPSPQGGGEERVG